MPNPLAGLTPALPALARHAHILRAAGVQAGTVSNSDRRVTGRTSRGGAWRCVTWDSTAGSTGAAKGNA